MSRILARACQFLGCAAALLCLVQTAAAQAATRFAGSYEVTGVVENSEKVQLKIALTLINPERDDVTGGIVALMDSTPSEALLGSFAAIKSLPAYGHVTVNQSFTISAAEYARWHAGHAPRFQFLIKSGDAAVAVDIQTHQTVLPGQSTN